MNAMTTFYFSASSVAHDKSEADMPTALDDGRVHMTQDNQ